jgi:hypothetical protein
MLEVEGLSTYDQNQTIVTAGLMFGGGMLGGAPRNRASDQY